MPFIHNYFGFNKQQRNGLLVLLVISFVLLVARIIYPFFIKPGHILVQNLPLVAEGTDSSSVLQKPGDTPATQLFIFDPNSVTAAGLKQLGFPEKTARTLLKFRKTFVFRKTSDLKKVYGVTPELYKSLEPFIVIGEKEKPPPRSKMTTAQTAEKIELNGADSLALLSLNGVGPSFAKRIIKYRALLGGYVNVEQLNEVYGFTPELFQKVRDHVTADPLKIKKINLNKDDFKTVNRHPYISYELTKTLFDWRRKTLLNPVNLKDILNDQALYGKLLPYLAFE